MKPVQTSLLDDTESRVEPSVLAQETPIVAKGTPTDPPPQNGTQTVYDVLTDYIGGWKWPTK